MPVKEPLKAKAIPSSTQAQKPPGINSPKKRKSSVKLKIWWVLPASFFYMELIFSFLVLKTPSFSGFLLSSCFAFSAGFLFTALIAFWGKKTDKILFLLSLVFFSFLFSVQTVYHSIFGKLLIFYSIGNGGQALSNFWGIALKETLNCIPIILLIFLPTILFGVFSKKFQFSRKQIAKKRIACLMASILFYLFAFIVIFSVGNLKESYTSGDSIDISARKFGLITAERLDIKNFLFPNQSLTLKPEEPQPEQNSETSSETPENPDTPPEPVYTDQVMNIDFEKLIASEKDDTVRTMHEYFASQTPSKTNPYTGMFRGKNLIFITAEAFSPYAIREDLTPTLYKMWQDGFQFKNFYTPSWGVSTSDGEYVACTGLIPKPGDWSFRTSGRQKNYLPFTMGMQFSGMGVPSYAYHNHTYNYYGRDVSHPNMGYTYKALGNGLDVAETWPESDLEMIEKTTGDYLNGQPFHAYYMTVSGHLYYTFAGNYIASKNKEYVKHLDYSEPVQAYLACNLELEFAMTELLKRLEAAGVAEDTVIAISPDHYPYGLTNKELNELAGHSIEPDFELYRSAFLLYSPGMKEPVIVEKPASSLDIIPTLSNLFGMTFDSRLLMGRDLLSDAEPLVIFADQSFITEKGRYQFSTNTFTPNEGVTADDEYISRIKTIVKNRTNVSAQMLTQDYYAKVLKP